MPNETLKQKTIKGLITQFTTSIGLKLLSFIQIIVFARLFAPNDYGIFATASIVVSFVMLFGEMGINQYIVRERKDPRKVMDTAFSMNLLVGFLFFSMIFFLAPFAADFFKNPDLVLYIRFLSYSAFGATLGLPGLMWVRDMKFGMARLPVFMTAIGNLVAAYIAVVFFHLGTWGLFIGGFVGFLGNALTTWILAPYKPKPGFDIDIAKKLYSFGWPLFFSSILGFIIWQGDSLIVRFLWGDEALGYYSFAFFLPVFLLKLIRMVNGVMLPVFSKIQDSKEKLEYAFNLSNKYIALIFAPLGMSLFAFTPQIIHFVFTDKWITAVPLLRFFSLGFTIIATTSLTWRQLAITAGKTRYIMYRDILNAVLLCTVGIYLISLYGTLGGAYYNVLISATINPLFACMYIKKEFGNLSFLRKIWIPIFVSFGLAFLIYFIEPQPTNIYLFIILLLFYHIIYILLMVIIDKNLIKEIKSFIQLKKSIPF